MKNKICDIFKIQYPIIQAGMIWASGWRLASAAANSGCLGLIGAGSMHPETLIEHIRKCKRNTDKPFGVNVPMLYPDIEKIMNIIVEEEVKIVFTSAGNPKTWTSWLKKHDIKVVHVVASMKFAKKSEDAGVDAVVAEGFEAGGHNGKEETTTMCLIPMVREEIKIPLIAAGGIATGKQMLAAMVLGADGVQIGTRFAASLESSCHDNFKKRITEVNEGDTILTLKKIGPVRLIKNKFAEQVQNAEDSGATSDDFKILLGQGRAKKGMFEGNLEEGELEIGQASAMIREIKPVKEIVEEIIAEYEKAKEKIY
ncbi:MAG: nitronate monooxygenase [Bacteroidota bacterium]